MKVAGYVREGENGQPEFRATGGDGWRSVFALSPDDIVWMRRIVREAINYASEHFDSFTHMTGVVLAAVGF